MGGQSTGADQRIARIAAGAYGIATRAEILAVQVTARQIDRRLSRGSLVKVFPGVYHVGHGAITTEARYFAAVKACGVKATLVGTAAAHHLGLVRGRPPKPQVAAPTKKRIKGVETSERAIHARERFTHKRIPCTTPARTLLDLAATLDPAPLSRVVHEAQIRFKTTEAQIEAVIAGHPNAPGRNKLASVVRGADPTVLSHLEEAFIRLLRQHELPRPATNQPHDAHFVDCRWPEHRLTVELDGFRFHNSRHSWQQDRLREREAYARGDQFRRYTYEDVCEDERQMLDELSALLG